MKNHENQKRRISAAKRREGRGRGGVRRAPLTGGVRIEKKSISGCRCQENEGGDRGNLRSRANGNIRRTLVEMSEKAMQDGIVPGTLKGQNLGHNSKRESLGPNTKRK